MAATIIAETFVLVGIPAASLKVAFTEVQVMRRELSSESTDCTSTETVNVAEILELLEINPHYVLCHDTNVGVAESEEKEDSATVEDNMKQLLTVWDESHPEGRLRSYRCKLPLKKFVDTGMPRCIRCVRWLIVTVQLFWLRSRACTDSGAVPFGYSSADLRQEQWDEKGVRVWSFLGCRLHSTIISMKEAATSIWCCQWGTFK